MCKHILIRQFDKKTDLDILKKFSSMTYDRDGYGAIIRTKQNELMTIKSLDSGSFYIDLARLIECLDVSELVVHHRTSTNKHGLEYAHPFNFKGNYLTHNGVVSVPGNHDTLTENDSEYLLHHLIKTNYQTNTIKGYFSCFILNETETTILVDSTAPIYSDSRVYCSHKLADNMQKIELQKIVYSGDILKSTDAIEVITSSYGMDSAWLSLGTGKSDNKKYLASDSVDDFLYCLTPNDEYYIAESKNSYDMRERIKDTASYIGIELNDEEIQDISDYFVNYSDDSFNDSRDWMKYE